MIARETEALQKYVTPLDEEGYTAIYFPADAGDFVALKKRWLGHRSVSHICLASNRQNRATQSLFQSGRELEPKGVPVTTVTVRGAVKSGTHFDPHLIAEEFWKLHQPPVGKFQREIVDK